MCFKANNLTLCVCVCVCVCVSFISVHAIFFFRWMWQHFQFLFEHIAQLPRRTVVSFTARLQPAANDNPPAATTREAPVDAPPVPPAPREPDDSSLGGTPASTDTQSQAGTNPDVILCLLGTTKSGESSHRLRFFCRRKSSKPPTNHLR